MEMLNFMVLQLLSQYNEQCKANGETGNLKDFSKLLNGFTEFVYGLEGNLANVKEGWVKDFNKEWKGVIDTLKGKDKE